VLFDERGITKADLFDYYAEVAPALVPHLRDRPFTMKRFREGLAGEFFFQKDAPKGMPSWIPTRTFETRQRDGRRRDVNFPLVNSADALLWMVQMHCIDMNAWLSRVDLPQRPDVLVLDLDPPEDGFARAVELAHAGELCESQSAMALVLAGRALAASP
jgi:bifunctional non-homologous end joining protein LigD